MSQFKYTSWGRTRSPKNLAGNVPGAEIICESSPDNLRSNQTGYKLKGYATENQRYLHVLVEDATTSDDPSAVTIFGYCHAFEKWFEIPESEAGGEGQNTANAAASIDIGNVGARAPAAQVPSDREYRRYDICGIDRVAFVNSTAAQVNVFAACSTF
tara:strand:+ start:335 stop:805 length:471 start_codon:yes stop_codon:yes gene_type:complete